MDPNYGDDAHALSQNPNPQKTPGNRPLSQHVSDTQNLPGYLQHAPYSFKTVGAALNWIRTTFPANSNRYLPWSNPKTSQGVDYIVIHCLPGLYGPTLSPSLTTDPYSGMNWNGESFPLDIPQRVSIQGSSALDTIFDARGYENGAPNVSVFWIHWTSPSDGHQFQYTFIDNVTIRGARGDGSKTGPGTSRIGAGVLIDDEAPADPFITNCVFTNNTVGIGVWSDKKEPNIIIHQPTIVNNTFAWNQVGIWNGSSYDTPSKGRNKLIVLNNIFDTAEDPARITAMKSIVGISAFEGVDFQDRFITTRNGLSLNLDANAYEVATLTRTNLGSNLSNPPTSWPRTVPRTSGGPYNPVVPIQNYTNPNNSAYGLGSAGRKVLYINDTFWRYIFPQSPKIAQHDFRIAPYAESTNGWGVNPLINRGVDFGINQTSLQPLWTGNLTFSNGRALTQAPGLPPASFNTNAGPEDIAQLNGWDWDMDGHGNPRVADRRFAIVRPALPSDSRIDLGADESGELTISGFLTNTRIFSRNHASVASNTSNFPLTDGLYFFNVYHGPGNSNNIYDRPWYNFLADIVYTNSFLRLPGSEWFRQIQTNPYATTATGLGNYTDGRYDARGYVGNLGIENLRLWFQTYVPTSGTDPRKPQPPFMRNLACDLSPHLVHDLPPNFSNRDQWWIWWGERFDHHRPAPGLGYPNFPIHSPVYDDLFKANPWFNNTYQTDAQWTDNPSLFHNSADTGTWNQLGIIAPPLTLPQNTLLNSTKSYLFLNSLHAWLWWDPPLTHLYTVIAQGYSNPDPVPFYTGSDWHGLRINMELIAPDDSHWGINGINVPRNNLQTFLTVESDTLSPESFVGSSLSPNFNLGVEGKAREKMKAFLKKRLLDQKK